MSGNRNNWLIEQVSGTVKKFGNSAHIVLPKSWAGYRVIVRIDDGHGKEVHQ